MRLGFSVHLARCAIIAAIATISSASAYDDAPINLSGKWKTDSDGRVVIVQDGNQVSWEARSPDGRAWSNHFDGHLEGNILRGFFYDHPPGHNRFSGELVFEVDGDQLKRINQTRAFYDTIFKRVGSFQDPPPGYHPPGANNLAETLLVLWLFSEFGTSGNQDQDAYDYNSPSAERQRRESQQSGDN